MASELVTVDDVRHFMLDRGASDNFLLDDVEFDDSTILKGMEFTVDKFNTTHPLVSHHSLENFPYRAELIMGTAAYCLRAAAMNMMRNELKTRTAGGTGINDKSGAGNYLAVANEISKDLDAQFRQIKISINVEGCYGIV